MPNMVYCSFIFLYFYSPVSGMEFNVEKLLSGVKRNIYGNIVGAKAATMLWVLHKKTEVSLKKMYF